MNTPAHLDDIVSTSTMPIRVAIVGGGLSGLTAAYTILDSYPHAQVTVYEAGDRVGGKLHTVDLGFGPIDVGAEAYLAFREDATSFFASLGLGDRIVEPVGLPSALYLNGAVHPLPRNTIMGIPSSSADVEGIVDTQTAYRIDHEHDLEPIEWSETADANLGQLVRERLGDQVVDRLVTPLLGGVYSTRADDLGMRATVPELVHRMDELAAAGEPVYLTDAVARVMERRRARNEARLTGGANSRAQGADGTADTADSAQGTDGTAGGAHAAQGATAPTSTVQDAPAAKKPVVFKAFAGGYADLLGALEQKICATGGDIRLGAAVTGIRENTSGGYDLTIADRDGTATTAAAAASSASSAGTAVTATGAAAASTAMTAVAAESSDAAAGTATTAVAAESSDAAASTATADAVIVATPADVAAPLLADIAPHAAQFMRDTPVASSVVLAMYWKDELNLPATSGVLIAPSAGTNAKAFTFSSGKWPHVKKLGGTLVRASFGHLGDDHLVSETAEHLTELAMADLAAIAGVTDAPDQVYLQRWWGGLPAYGVGREPRAAEASAELTSIPGLATAGAAWDGVGIPACIQRARSAAVKVLVDLLK